MVDSLKTGDKVVMTSGIIGVIVNVKGNRFVVKIDDNAKVEVFKSYILSKVDK